MNTVKLMRQKLNISYHKVSVSQPVYDFKGGKNQKISRGKLVICHKVDFGTSMQRSSGQRSYWILQVVSECPLRR